MKHKSKWKLYVAALLIITNAVTFTVTIKMVTSEFPKLFQVKAMLEKYYDGNIDENVLDVAATKAMTAALKDPYTVFMDSSEYKTFMNALSGDFVGVGVQIEVKDGKITVVSPLEDSPAKKSGILSGDIILKVNDADISGKTVDQVATLIRGEAGTTVKIEFYREGKGNFTVDLKRASIILSSVKGEMINGEVGYIQISGFDANTDVLFNKELASLISKGMKGLVLDLRGNGGGYLYASVNIASNFVEKGKTIVYTVDKYNKKAVENSKGGLWIGKPLVVLVDGGSASASEVFSGAIRDYNAGTLVGTKTFGKGIVQATISDKSDGTALKVTISKYYSPHGININKIGITPDVIIELPDNFYNTTYNRAKDTQFQSALHIVEGKLK